MGTLKSLHYGLENTFVNFKWTQQLFRKNMDPANVKCEMCRDIMNFQVVNGFNQWMADQANKSWSIAQHCSWHVRFLTNLLNLNPWKNCINFWSENSANIPQKSWGASCRGTYWDLWAWGCWEWGRGDAKRNSSGVYRLLMQTFPLTIQHLVMGGNSCIKKVRLGPKNSKTNWALENRHLMPTF